MISTEAIGNTRSIRWRRGMSSDQTPVTAAASALLGSVTKYDTQQT